MPQDLKAKIRRVFDEAYNKGHLEAYEEIFSSDFLRHRPPLPDIHGLAAYQESITALRATYPDLHLIVHEILVEGDSHAVRWTMQGTHTGHGGSFPPSGNAVSFDGITLSHRQNGLVVEEWALIDNLGVMQQMGVLPRPKART